MKKILIVEDEDIISKDIKSMIDEIGLYTSLIARSGEEALSLYTQENPDLILMDVNLRCEMDGIKTAEAIKKIADVPIIYLTAYADKATVKRASRTQPSGYLLKPFNEIEVRTNIDLAIYKHYMNQKLRERERLLSSTLTKIGLGIIKTDDHLKIQFINDVALTLLCLNERNALEKNINEIMTIVDQENRKKNIDKNKINSYGDEIYVKVNGNRIPVNLFIESIEEDEKNQSFVFILRDLSEKIKIEKKIWTTANMLERIIQSIQSAVIITSKDFIIKDCNKAASKIFGYAKDELITRAIDFLYPDDSTDLYHKITLDKAIKNNLYYQAIETQLIRKNKEQFPAEFTIAPLIDNKIDISGWVLTVSDITKKKNYETILKQAKIAAEKANEAKTTFLTTMSHELRTPLNSIIGMTELTLGTELTAEQQEYLTIVKQASYSFLHVLNNILDFSKLEVDKVELEETLFKLNDIIKNIYDLLKFQIDQKKLQFSISIDPRVPKTLYGDSYRLKQILTNLVANAIKFTEFGKISVDIRLVKHNKKQITLHCMVKDTGIGIPKQKLDTIFESFRQIDGSMTRKYGGTGLGLAICKRLTLLMGGSIWVETEINKGSTFHFQVNFRLEKNNRLKRAHPVSQQQVRVINQPKTADNPISRIVLVIEDDKNTQKLILDVLEKRGHCVFCVSNGKEALHLLGMVQFDIILMDLKMPLLDGIETTKIIRSEKKNVSLTNIPIIGITAYALQETEKHCIAAGMNGYIPKPIDFDTLISFVEKKYDGLIASINPKTPRQIKNKIFDEGLFLASCTNNKSPHIFYKEICIKLEKLISSIKKATQHQKRSELERYASVLRALAIKIGAEALKDDALRLKIASRKKTMDKAIEIEKILSEHIIKIEDAIKCYTIKHS